MARLTDIDDLLDGVSVWYGIPAQELERLIPQPERAKGIGGGATTKVQDIAWERCIDDFSEQGVDIEDSDLTDDEEDRIKAACCNLVMYLLYDRAVLKEGDSNSFLASKYRKEYQRIIRTTDIETPTGQDVDMGGGGVEILRGS
jgi:hypothetical protein